MQVTSEARPNTKRIAVTLTEDDVNVDGLNTMEKWQKMSKTADMLLVEYMLRSGDITKELADQRMREIQSGTVA